MCAKYWKLFQFNTIECPTFEDIGNYYRQDDCCRCCCTVLFFDDVGTDASSFVLINIIAIAVFIILIVTGSCYSSYSYYILNVYSAGPVVFFPCCFLLQAIIVLL